jgi:hypothetical protein
MVHRTRGTNSTGHGLRQQSVWKWVFRTSMLSTILAPWVTMVPPFRR